MKYFETDEDMENKKVIITAIDKMEGGIELKIDVHLPIAQARDFANNILASCDVVDGKVVER